MNRPWFKPTIGLLAGLWAASMMQGTVTIPPLVAAEGPLQIAMLRWRGDTEAEGGFKDGLQKLGYAATGEKFLHCVCVVVL